MSAAHQELLCIAERQLALADAGRWDELPTTMELFHRHAATLPPIAPPSAATSLKAAASIVARVEERLRAGRMECARELSRLQRSRGAVRSYAGVAITEGSRVDGAA